MSWHVNVTGRDKQKLKDAVRSKQCEDEEKSPHNGVPKRVVDFLCSEIDRCRLYQWEGKIYGLKVEGSGSFHEQGISESINIMAVELVE